MSKFMGPSFYCMLQKDQLSYHLSSSHIVLGVWDLHGPSKKNILYLCHYVSCVGLERPARGSGGDRDGGHQPLQGIPSPGLWFIVVVPGSLLAIPEP